MTLRSRRPSRESAGLRPAPRWAAGWARLATQYGMLGVLLLLAVFFSLVTLRDQHPTGRKAAAAVIQRLEEASVAPGAGILIAARAGEADAEFARSVAALLDARGRPAAGTVLGGPADLRQALVERAERSAERLVIVTPEGFAPVVRSVLQALPDAAGWTVLTPPSYRWPTFLLAENLLNVAQQIAVIAMIAIGMTMVIITGGIDLSVGSLIAFAAVVTAGMIGRLGGAQATGAALFLGGLVAVLLSGLVGAFSGTVITRFKVPPFIATLGMMQVTSGLAYILSHGKPIYQLPDSFVALGRSSDPVVGVPYAVLLMLALYGAAHLLMTRTKLGRYIYAVGGNAEAARLSGVRVNSVLLFVYTICGMLAGLGGVVMASQLKSGAPTYGLMYELYVIAAVVVGGTSLSGGEGRILGTLIGAFIIAVIQNGMNLTNVESYTQKVVLGLVILGAVLLDRLRHGGWWWRRKTDHPARDSGKETR